MNEMSLVETRIHSIYARFDSVGEKTETICALYDDLVPWGIGHWLSHIDRTYRAQTLGGLMKAKPCVGLTFHLADLLSNGTTSNE